MKYLYQSIIVLALLQGCATSREVIESGVAFDYSSKLSVPELTTCIDRNTDGAVLNSLQTTIKYSNPLNAEIVVRNGNFAYAVILIKSYEYGSVAHFRLGGTAAWDVKQAISRMTNGCQ